MSWNRSPPRRTKSHSCDRCARANAGCTGMSHDDFKRAPPTPGRVLQHPHLLLRSEQSLLERRERVHPSDRIPLLRRGGARVVGGWFARPAEYGFDRGRTWCAHCEAVPSTLKPRCVSVLIIMRSRSPSDSSPRAMVSLFFPPFFLPSLFSSRCSCPHLSCFNSTPIGSVLFEMMKYVCLDEELGKLGNKDFFFGISSQLGTRNSEHHYQQS